MEGKEIIKNMTIGSFSVVKAHRYFQVVSDRGVLVADCDYLDKKYPCPTPIAIRFNAELICEAFNIANQTGMTPTTLHAELEKAKELLKKSKSYFNTKDCFTCIYKESITDDNRTTVAKAIDPEYQKVIDHNNFLEVENARLTKVYQKAVNKTHGLNATNAKLVEALEELVELKRMKHLDGEYPSEEYLRRKPIAWNNAKQTLQNNKKIEG